MGYKVLGSDYDGKIKTADFSSLSLCYLPHRMLENLAFLCIKPEIKPTDLLIISSNFAKSVCGNAGSSSSICGGASPWPCSSGGVAGEFSLEESGDEVLIKN